MIKEAIVGVVEATTIKEDDAVNPTPQSEMASPKSAHILASPTQHSKGWKIIQDE